MGDWIDLLNSFATSLRNGQLPELGPWTYPILVLLVAVEGPIATLLGAAAASAGLMRPGPVFISCASGNLLADSLWYSLGYLGKMDWVLRFGKRLKLDQRHLERLENNLRQHAVKVIFLAKLTVSFSIPTLIAAGLIRAPWRKWFFPVFVGEMMWTTALMLVGYYATEAIKRAEQGLEYMALFGSALFLMVVLWWGRRIKKKQVEENIEIHSGDGPII